ncbi:unnamed protein product [Cladocopium goreaui]|uniref:Exonuclease mut-7 homolog (Exonuclease 3'-5 ' domain-containing protein 3) n=1 Tax=Cladocopium goreaui TaxID=2562237 RepID=A0A9P1CSY1_9DINO|nr:unnamed protein product [Cladocopium goreaui]
MSLTVLTAGSLLQLRDLLVASALAAVALGALPGLLCVQAEKVLEVADDGSRDEAIELMAKGFEKEAKCFLVRLRQEKGRLKAAAKAVQALALQEDFPDADFLWKQEALEAAICKGRKEALVGLSCQEPRLHSRCVHGLVECNEVELAVDLAMAWNIAISMDLTQRLQDAIAKREAESLCLPATVSVIFLDQEAQVERLSSLLSADAIGFDLECNMSTSKPTLFQLGSVHEIFLVDLLAVGELPALAAALQEVWRSKMPKVGFGGAEDIGKLAGTFPALGLGSHSLVDLKDLEATLRAHQLNIGKKKAVQGISLSSIAEKYLGKPLDKSFQVGDWSRRPISKVRAHYAALDAWVPVKATLPCPKDPKVQSLFCPFIFSSVKISPTVFLSEIPSDSRR